MRFMLAVALLAALLAAPVAAQTYTCVRTGQATTSAATGILDLACTENVTPAAEYDFRVTADRGSSSYARYRVVALSRPFGAIVLDARVECDDGTFYDAPRSLTTTEPLAVGQAGGELAVDVGDCAGTFTKITLTPYFPEWTCDGCGEYVPER